MNQVWPTLIEFHHRQIRFLFRRVFVLTFSVRSEIKYVGIFMADNKSFVSWASERATKRAAHDNWIANNWNIMIMNCSRAIDHRRFGHSLLGIASYIWTYCTEVWFAEYLGEIASTNESRLYLRCWLSSWTNCKRRTHTSSATLNYHRRREKFCCNADKFTSHSLSPNASDLLFGYKFEGSP